MSFISMELKNSLRIDGVPQWKLFYYDSFDLNADGWSLKPRQRCGGHPDHHLGGYCQLSYQNVSKVFPDLPPHKRIKIQARFHFIDKWQGEYGYMKVNDDVMWIEHHHHCRYRFASSCHKGINVCGDSLYSDTLSSSISITLSHSTSHVEITFGSSLPRAGSPCIASYGVDDVMIYVNSDS